MSSSLSRTPSRRAPGVIPVEGSVHQHEYRQQGQQAAACEPACGAQFPHAIQQARKEAEYPAQDPERNTYTCPPSLAIPLRLSFTLDVRCLLVRRSHHERTCMRYVPARFGLDEPDRARPIAS
jgi:hypothetical protein